MIQRSLTIRACALLLAGLLLLFPACAAGEPDSEPEVTHHDEDETDQVILTPEATQRAQIQIVDSRLLKLQDSLEATGVVSADEARVAHIRPLARGVIEKVFVRRGDRVTAGQPLVQYDNIELGDVIGEHLSQKAQLNKYLAMEEVARKFWERDVLLLEKQAIAQKEVELSEAEYKNAQATVVSQRAEISRTEEKLHRFGLTEAEIQALAQEHVGDHRTASHNTLRAPFAGVILAYDVAEGELVDPSRELLTLADVSTVWVMADIYEKDLGQVRENRPVEIQSPSYPDRTFSGQLTYISDVLEKDTRTARVRCVVLNSDNLLKLEMFVTVRIPTIRQITAVVVPEEAIQNLDGQDVVFVVEEPERFRKVPVETGLREDGWIEVSGLKPGTPVVAEGSFYLKSTLLRSEIEPEH